MEIVIIGTGNVATVLGVKLQTAGHSILQVIGRREDNTARLADELGCPWTTRREDLDDRAAIYIVALSDDALHGFGKEMILPRRLVVHTAGAVPMEILLPVTQRCGVLYPLQSLRREIRPFPEIPLLVDARQPEDLELISSIARSISGQVQQADDDTRLRLHLSAIFVNNFTNHLFLLAKEFCKKEDMDFRLLLPLIRETAGRLTRFSPEEVQTGPAIRGDGSTMRKHIGLLTDHPDMRDLYTHFSRLIFTHYKGSEIPFPL